MKGGKTVEYNKCWLIEGGKIIISVMVRVGGWLVVGRIIGISAEG